MTDPQEIYDRIAAVYPDAKADQHRHPFGFIVLIVVKDAVMIRFETSQLGGMDYCRVAKWDGMSLQNRFYWEDYTPKNRWSEKRDLLREIARVYRGIVGGSPRPNMSGRKRIVVCERPL